MLKEKIKITDKLLNYMQNTRKEKGISAFELSLAIGRATSYISTMENKRISKISSKDLIKIFEILHYISEEEAIAQIEELLYGISKQKPIKPSIPITDENSPNWGNFNNIIKYNLPFNFHYADLFNIELKK